MSGVPLYGLYVGNQRPPKGLDAVGLSSLRIALVEEYDTVVHAMPQNSAREESAQLTSGQGLVSHDIGIRMARDGGWVHTADAAVVDPEASSVLVVDDLRDGGVWDACQILTFLTGRLVTHPGTSTRNDPTLISGPPLCAAVEVLRALGIAWGNRRTLVERELLWALLNYTEALRFDSLQTRAFHMSAALNVLVDKLTPTPLQLDSQVRDSLKRDLEEWLIGRTDLSDAQRAGLVPQLRATVDKTGNFTDRTILLLHNFDILPPVPSEDELRRVRFINRLRNRMVHQGSVPTLQGLSAEQSLEYALHIFGVVLPEIVGLILGRVLGFTTEGPGSLSQHPEDLRAFFKLGEWQGYKVESAEFDKWFLDLSRSELLSE